MAAQRTPELAGARPGAAPRPRPSLRRLLTDPVGGTLLTLVVVGAVFAFDEPDESAAQRAWVLTSRALLELPAALPVASRLRAMIDPRPRMFSRRVLRWGTAPVGPRTGPRQRTGVQL